MSSSIHFYILTSIGLSILGLGVWVKKSYQSSQGIQYYSFLLFALGNMATISGLTFLQFSAETMLWLVRLGYFFGMVTFCMLLMFSFFFPIPNRRISPHITFVWVLPICILGTLIFSSPLFIQSVDSLLAETRGSLYWAFPLFIVLSMILTLRNLFRKRSIVQGKDKFSLHFFSVILVITSLVGLIFDVLLPSLGVPRLYIGIYSSVALVIISSYIIFRK